MDSLRVQYLQRMGIEVWVPRADTAPGTPAATNAATQLSIGPGRGSQLWVCERAELSALPLAADLERCLADPPVWAWPAEDEGVTLEEAVRENLFTNVVIFGETLAQRLLESDAGPGPGSARVVRAPAIDLLRHSPQERRACWRLLAANGLIPAA